MAKERTPVPPGVAARVLFAANRTCCICRVPGKPVQIHHIDEDPTNHDPVNLAVLCLECHEQTQVKGGFSRRLDGDQIKLYRDDWIRIVAGQRSTPVGGPTPERQITVDDASLATTLVEVNRETENWINLAVLYNRIGNETLRDKAVDDAIAAGVSDDMLLLLRGMQGRMSDVPHEVIAAARKRLSAADGYRSLASLQADLGEHRQAAEAYIRGLMGEMDKFSSFTLAHHLNELVELDVIPALFVDSLEDSAAEDDLWWQVRALEELGWTAELHQLVLENEARIESDPELEEEQRVRLHMILAQAKGDDDAYREARVAQERIDAETDWNS